MRLAASAGLCLGVVLTSASVALPRCDPTTDPDKTDVANARAAVAANCDCDNATSHGAYVSCAAQQADATLVNKSCARAVKKCAARSTCGKPGSVTCCVTRTAGTKCKVKRDATHCAASNGSTACVGSYTSCCDACTPTGCATTSTSTTSSSATTMTMTTTTTSCPPATALYCGGANCGYGGGAACGQLGRCPQGMSCTTAGTSCACTGAAIPCGDPRLSGLTCNFCKWGTCPLGMTCGGVPKTDACGYDCACQ
jgi:hypothetical protein